MKTGASGPSYKIIRRHFGKNSVAEDILVGHGEAVAQKARAVAERFPEIETDYRFLFEAALLHDIGMIETAASSLGCFGPAPYIQHGIIGRRILENEGLPRHALVCERHFLTGVSREDILGEGMDLPPRDMLPLSWEEKLICYADCFFSKKPRRLEREKSPGAASQGLPDFCKPVFARLLREFREPYETLATVSQDHTGSRYIL